MRRSKLKHAVLWIVCASITWSVPGQPVHSPSRLCNTAEEVIPWLQHFQRNPSLTPRSNEMLYVAIAVHIVGTNSGHYPIQPGRVLDAICTLNQQFAHAGIMFFLQGGIRHISNSAYYDHISGQTGLEMMQRHNADLAINTYFVFNAVDACGYTLRDRTGRGIGIALSSSCTGANTSTWAHEMGHFLSLPHTFHGWEAMEHNFAQPAPLFVGNVAVEFADGSNCQTAGDGFCDTPPDYLNGRWFCNAQAFSAITQFDPFGRAFTSDGSLFMSYAADPCPTRFSPMQIAAMRAYLREVRQDILFPAFSLDLMLREEIQLVFPESAFFIPSFQEVFLQWRRVKGSSGYVVELSQIPTFAFISAAYVTQDTSMLLTDLLPARTYYWRIRPFNLLSTCRLYSPVRSFITGTVTSTVQRSEERSFEVFPNPVASGALCYLRIHSEGAEQAAYSLLDISGKQIMRGQWLLSPGDNQLEWKAPSISGTYVLRMHCAGKTLIKKLAVLP